MTDAVKVLVIGGQKRGLHDYAELGPIFERFLSEAGFVVTLTDDPGVLSAESLESVDVLVNFTTAVELSDEQEAGLLGSVKKGLGFVGVHAATDTFLNSERYVRMVGGRFLTHPSKDWSVKPPKCPVHGFHVCDREHPITAGLDDFEMPEELYLMETYPPYHLLMTSDFQDFERPVAWVKPYGFGRVFYTALGHGAEQLEDSLVQKMIANGVRWAKSPYGRK